LNPEITVQVYAGGYSEEPVPLAVVLDKLTLIQNHIPVNRVIIGWSPSQSLYRGVGDYLRERGMEFFLWLPVFAAEDFSFTDPEDPKILQTVLDTYDARFGGLGFGGVFLDRIRYPADGRDHGANCGAVTGAVAALSAEFRKRGLKIGLDVFAPFLSRRVGQDIPALSNYADFVKPMMYLRTDAPAGIPYETRTMPDKPDLAHCRRDIAGLAEASACPVYAGVEWNVVPGIADPDPPYLRDSLSAYAEAGARGFVLSWNALDAPIANIAALSGVL
jgi:hypothetical protein